MKSSLWFRLDAIYYYDNAILEAGEAAEILFVRALGLAKMIMSDGFLTHRQLTMLGLENLDQRIASLVKQNLWIEEKGGWQIRSWFKWNLSVAQMEENKNNKPTDEWHRLYNEYLQSDEWARKRDMATRVSLGACSRCNQRAVLRGADHVHHLTYERVRVVDGKLEANEKLEDLMPVCASCHNELHGRQ